MRSPWGRQTMLALLTAAAPLACSSKPSEPREPAPAARPPPGATSQPAAPGSQPAAAPFSGEVRLRAGFGAAIVGPTDALFITVRGCLDGDCARPGPFVAAQRFRPVKLPLAFSLGPADMVTTAPFVGPFLVEARIDRDGDAMTKTPDDLYAHAVGVRPGQRGLILAVAPPTAE